MADSNSYKQEQTLAALFAQAGERETKAMVELAEVLNLAPQATEWPEELRKLWIDGLQSIFEESAGKKVTPEEERLLLAMMNAGVDSQALRENYLRLFGALCRKCTNPAGVCQVIGFEDPAVPVNVIARRLAVYRELAKDRKCYDKGFGTCVVVAVDEEDLKVQLQQERLRSVDLSYFLDSVVVAKAGSIVEKLYFKQSTPTFDNVADFVRAALEGVVAKDPVDAVLLKKFLVPSALSENEYKIRSGEVAAQREANKAQSGSTPASAGAAPLRWDNSRSIAELEQRLAASASLDLDGEEPNYANVETLLSREAGRVDLADKWVASISYIYKSGRFNERLNNLLISLCENVAAWKNADLFVALSDKMPGKLVSYWLKATYHAKGMDYLVDNTVRMPYRLWTHTEKILEESGLKNVFEDRIFLDFAKGRPTPDHFYWLWKSKVDPSHAADRENFLADSYLLFKSLHREVKGNYLKSQRQLQKLMMDDASFQRALMKNGDPDAIKNLIRCVNHLPLLEAGEKQSLLVKISRLYDKKVRNLVEKSKPTTVEAAAVVSRKRITSIHSYVLMKEKYRKLVDEEIPDNRKKIEEARAHGDLSENSEFKYAKEQQAFLNAREREWKQLLNEVQPDDFRDCRVEKTVIVGCVVTLHYQADGHTNDLTILGVMDGDTDRNIFSYESPIGKLLWGRSVGERLTLPDGSVATIAGLKALSEELLQELGSDQL